MKLSPFLWILLPLLAATAASIALFWPVSDGDEAEGAAVTVASVASGEAHLGVSANVISGRLIIQGSQQGRSFSTCIVTVRVPLPERRGGNLVTCIPNDSGEFFVPIPQEHALSIADLITIRVRDRFANVLFEGTYPWSGEPAMVLLRKPAVTITGRALSSQHEPLQNWQFSVIQGFSHSHDGLSYLAIGTYITGSSGEFRFDLRAKELLCDTEAELYLLGRPHSGFETGVLFSIGPVCSALHRRQFDLNDLLVARCETKIQSVTGKTGTWNALVYSLEPPLLMAVKVWDTGEPLVFSLAPAKYRLRLLRQGYDAEDHELEVDESNPNTLIRVQSHASTRHLRLHAEDCEGRPLAAAQIELRREDSIGQNYELNVLGQRMIVECDESGDAKVPLAPTSHIASLMDGPFYVSSYRVSGSADSVRIKAPEGGQIQFSAKSVEDPLLADVYDNGVELLLVNLQTSKIQAYATDILPWTSGFLESGNYFCAITLRPYWIGMETIHVDKGTVAASIPLSHGYLFHGSLRLSAGEPVAYRRVRASPTSTAPFARDWSDSDGHFALLAPVGTDTLEVEVYDKTGRNIATRGKLQLEDVTQITVPTK